MSETATRNAIKEIRTAHGFTQKELAEKLGCSVPTVKRLEAIGQLPSNAAVLRNLRALATLAGIDLDAGKVTA